MKKITLLLLVSIFLSSCVTKKQLTYLQEDEVAKSEYNFTRLRYEVQPNDILSITVKSVDPEAANLFNSSNPASVNLNAGDLTFYLNGYTINGLGEIQMPILGNVHVAGKSVDEIKLQIEKNLNEYFTGGTVHVSVQLAGIRYSVVGDVAKPGRYVIYQNQVNIFEALAQAGDITLVGDRKQVMLVRQYEDKVKTIYLDLTDSKVISNPYYFVQPNDIINVKPLAQKSLGIGTTGFQSFASIIGVLASTITLIIALNNLN